MKTLAEYEKDLIHLDKQINTVYRQLWTLKRCRKLTYKLLGRFKDGKTLQNKK